MIEQDYPRDLTRSMGRCARGPRLVEPHVASVEPRPIRNGLKGVDRFQGPKGKGSKCSLVNLR